jgi:hypothetical protein
MKMPESRTAVLDDGTVLKYYKDGPWQMDAGHYTARHEKENPGASPRKGVPKGSIAKRMKALAAERELKRSKAHMMKLADMLIEAMAPEYDDEPLAGLGKHRI